MKTVMLYNFSNNLLISEHIFESIIRQTNKKIKECYVAKKKKKSLWFSFGFSHFMKSQQETEELKKIYCKMDISFI